MDAVGELMTELVTFQSQQLREKVAYHKFRSLAAKEGIPWKLRRQDLRVEVLVCFAQDKPEALVRCGCKTRCFPQGQRAAAVGQVAKGRGTCKRRGLLAAHYGRSEELRRQNHGLMVWKRRFGG